ncbi:acyltransferase [Pseudoalteromonas sp. B5MOD-1]|uniref:acyltransferase n=1 Tax=unclassified Pseudoalteromonas TaxID=194690 RepID=UPI001BA616C9|nr:acyltransferase [Pseudoalteromonas sp. A22]QUI62434.1 acyltransferase [Pseudoalteromonas sp. A22]
MKNQIYFLVLRFLNFIINLMFFHCIKNKLLRFLNVKLSSSATINGRVRFFGFREVTVGINSCINFGCYLDNRDSIKIGDNVSIAHDVKIYTAGHDYNSNDFSFVKAPVEIGDNSVVFSNVLIMPGVKVGNGAVILPGSVVTKDLIELGVYGGVPAKLLRMRAADSLNYEINYKYWFAN